MSKRKLVMEEHEGNVLVGIMQDQCDPVIRTVEGTLDDALVAAPDFLKEAQEKWAVSPKNPTYTPPAAPKPAVAPAAATAPAQKAEDLPLLSGTEKPQPAEAPAEEKATVEVAAEEKAPEAEVEVTEPQAEPAEQEISQRIAEAPAPTAVTKPGEWEYYLQDGRGPFKSVQLAMDELGLDKNTRPMHNRWDRLSTALKEKIQRRPKA